MGHPKQAILYYTSHLVPIRIAKLCRKYIAASGLPITSVSLKPLDFGRNICMPGEPSAAQMFRQILAGLESMSEDVIWFAEHDCCYPKEHWDFTPEKRDVFYYDSNIWRIRDDGLAVHYDHQSTSGLCAYRELLLEEYRERVRRTEAEGYKNGGYEPGTRSKARGGYSDYQAERWQAKAPYLDIRHGGNLTSSRWKQSQFRDKTTCTNWQESTLDRLPGWGPEVAWLGERVPKPAPPPYHPKPQPNGARDLSILIPARNEMFLARTVEDLLEHKRANTEIIIGLDGAWAEPPLADHPDVHIIHHSASVGQRAITNECARLSRAKYILKADAHCAFAEGFDLEMLRAFEETDDLVTMVPVMRKLWVFDWECPKCGLRTYQGPTPTSCKGRKGAEKTGCDNTEGFRRVMVWDPKTEVQSKAYCFDSEPHFQYFREFEKRPEGKGDLTESMSLQGSAFMLTRERYWDLNVCDEAMGSWGSQGIEVACKSWLSGGRVLCNQRTWYAHCFRTQGGDFSFPYPQAGTAVQAAKAKARDLFFGNKWPGQVRPLSWLLEKFWPVPGWTDSDLDRLRAQPFD